MWTKETAPSQTAVTHRLNLENIQIELSERVGSNEYYVAIRMPALKRAPMMHVFYADGPSEAKSLAHKYACKELSDHVAKTKAAADAIQNDLIEALYDE